MHSLSRCPVKYLNSKDAFNGFPSRYGLLSPRVTSWPVHYYCASLSGGKTFSAGVYPYLTLHSSVRQSIRRQKLKYAPISIVHVFFRPQRHTRLKRDAIVTPSNILRLSNRQSYYRLVKSSCEFSVNAQKFFWRIYSVFKERAVSSAKHSPIFATGQPHHCRGALTH